MACILFLRKPKSVFRSEALTGDKDWGKSAGSRALIHGGTVMS